VSRVGLAIWLTRTGLAGLGWVRWVSRVGLAIWLTMTGIAGLGWVRWVSRVGLGRNGKAGLVLLGEV
jgi:hypothetical protein